MGYVFQGIGLFPHMTVEQNISVVLRLQGRPNGERRERAHELLQLVGLPPDDFGPRYPTELSGGQQQRVGVARALAADPACLLMDEPFGALDAITRGRMQEELLSIQRATGKTVLFVTHDVEEALTLAGRMAIMRRGEVVQYDTPLKVVSEPADEFVAELIGADDILKLMGLLRVEEAMSPPGEEELPPPFLGREDTLREALGMMLSTGRESLAVADDGGGEAGRVDLADLRRKIASREKE
jgi:osmoprotectant transport system ATP-binding protein